MVSNLENLILKELDRQGFRADFIAQIMSKLNNDDQRSDFLYYLRENSTVLISTIDLVNKIKVLNN